MAHSVELLLDDDADRRLRAEWSALADAGLPSAADIRAGTNRPHVTLIASPRIDTGVDAALGVVAQRLPLPVTLGAPLVFGVRNRHVLTRLVVPTSELLSVHAQVYRLAEPFTGADATRSAGFPHSRPGAWTPHITLGRGLTSAEVGTALTECGPFPDIPATVVAVRRWDSDAAAEHILAGRAC